MTYIFFDHFHQEIKKQNPGNLEMGYNYLCLTLAKIPK